MYEINIAGKNGNCQIIIGDLTISVNKITGFDEAIFITDQNLHQIYKDFLSGKKVIIIEPGEDSKSIEIILDIYNQLICYNADRKSLIIGFGGGVVTDIVGFVASTYMRGCRFGFISTSLLGIVDASIGGKNGINFGQYKNIIGTINQPEFVLINSKFLSTLPIDEFTNGMAEVIKHALIRDKSSFSTLLEVEEDMLDFLPRIDDNFIYNQVKIKADIVRQDENENKLRAILNFGHTFGHPIEKLYGLKHGFAVSLGMVTEAKIAQLLGYISTIEVEQIIDCLRKFSLPISIDLDKSKVIELMIMDKKKDQNRINFIALQSIGNAKIINLEIEKLIELFMNVEI